MRTMVRILCMAATAAAILAALIPAAAGAVAPPAQDGVLETWTVHLTGSSAARQGSIWLRETPCRQGFFFRMVAPCVKAEAHHAIVFVGSEELVTLSGDRLGFAIVLDEWPAVGFGDPSPAYLGWGADDPSPEVVYSALRGGDFGVKVYDADGTELLAGLAR